MAQGQPLTAHSMGEPDYKNFLQADLSFNIYRWNSFQSNPMVLNQPVYWFPVPPGFFNQTSF
jgi:hypothetical protein